VNVPGEISYARTRDGIDIAYTAFGEGPDLLVLPGFVSHLDQMWDFAMNRVLVPLGSRFRVIVLDKRGTGLSDRSLGFGSVEERAEDARAVLDAVGSEHAIVWGISEGGPMALYLAASHPERVRALALYGTYASMEPAAMARTLGARDVESVPKRQEAFLDAIEAQWGQGRILQIFVSRPPDPAAAARVLSRYERSACTPQMAREIMARNMAIDVRPFLPLVSVPTLVAHCTGDPVVPVELARALAKGIAGARYVEIDDDVHSSWRQDDMDRISEPVYRFLDEVSGQPESGAEPPGERELATVLFTDIVSSTERLSEAGDASWKVLLDRHEQAAARAIGAAGGRLVEHTGDGVLATFGGPSQAVAAARTLQDDGVSIGVAVRAGVHTGEIERRGARIGGIGVHIAARIMALANGGEILVSRTVRDLAIGSKLAFEARGSHTLKGVSDTWDLFAVS
jgi:pimeloyl-ACP methyl ester carboxylesterase/class 3 adenylate cyclase